MPRMLRVVVEVLSRSKRVVLLRSLVVAALVGKESDCLRLQN